MRNLNLTAHLTSRSFVRTAIVSAFAFAMMSCERSSKGVQVNPPPTNQGTTTHSGETPDTGDGLDANSKKKYGQIDLSVSGAPTSATKLALKWDFQGKSGSIDVVLLKGSGTASLKNVPVGSDELVLNGDIDGKAIAETTQSVVVSSSKTAEVSLAIKSDSPQNGGNIDIQVIPQIGPGKPNPQNGQTQSAWDGKSFQGNASWTITPIP